MRVAPKKVLYITGTVACIALEMISQMVIINMQKRYFLFIFFR